MPFIETKLKGAIIIESKVFADHRGYFFESYNKKHFADNGITADFVQDNESFSSRGTLRGLHYQAGEHAQAKLVRVIKGRVLDVAVDLREDSATYGQHVSVELSEDNKKLFFVPRGFGHGFVVLSETAIFSYKCDNFYNKASEGGIIYNDSTLNIDWGLEHKDMILSEKDTVLPAFGSHRKAI
jgi:dTDP-4-dehydrorhamnose 3,5-epimerase